MVWYKHSQPTGLFMACSWPIGYRSFFSPSPLGKPWRLGFDLYPLLVLFASLFPPFKGHLCFSSSSQSAASEPRVWASSVAAPSHIHQIHPRRAAACAFYISRPPSRLQRQRPELQGPAPAAGPPGSPRASHDSDRDRSSPPAGLQAPALAPGPLQPQLAVPSSRSSSASFRWVESPFFAARSAWFLCCALLLPLPS